jgi:hypothetical protein
MTGFPQPYKYRLKFWSWVYRTLVSPLIKFEMKLQQKGELSPKGIESLERQIKTMKELGYKFMPDGKLVKIKFIVWCPTCKDKMGEVELYADEGQTFEFMRHFHWQNYGHNLEVRRET